MSPQRTPHPPHSSNPPGPPAPPEARDGSGGGGGGESIIAVALGAMILVLLLIRFDLMKSGAVEKTPPFDLTNPLLLATPGACVDVEDSDFAGAAMRFFVRQPGPILRPRAAPASIPGYLSVGNSDLRESLPYLACEMRSAAAAPPGAPAARAQVEVFALNGFGMPIDTMCALRLIKPATVTWNGQTRRKAYEVLLQRFDKLEGPWHLYVSQDAPVLGTMVREYLAPHGGTIRQRFLISEGCR